MHWTAARSELGAGVRSNLSGAFNNLSVMAKRDYYSVLGVGKNATDEEIKKA